MTDAFETFLAARLAPPARDPDRKFVARVQAAILLDERLRAARRAELRALGLQALALFAVAGGLILFARSENIASLAAMAPGLTLLTLLCGFGLLVALLSTDRATVMKLNPR